MSDTLTVQVIDALTPSTVHQYDVPGIVAHLRREYGTDEVAQMPSAGFWSIVALYEVDAPRLPRAVITDRDMREQVLATLDGFHPEDYNVEAIVEEIQRVYGTVSVESIEDGAYWEIVARFDKTAY